MSNTFDLRRNPATGEVFFWEEGQSDWQPVQARRNPDTGEVFVLGQGASEWRSLGEMAVRDYGGAVLPESRNPWVDPIPLTARRVPDMPAAQSPDPVAAAFSPQAGQMQQPPQPASAPAAPAFQDRTPGLAAPGRPAMPSAPGIPGAPATPASPVATAMLGNTAPSRRAIPPMEMPQNPRLLTEGPGAGGGMGALYDQGILPRRYVEGQPQPDQPAAAADDPFAGESFGDLLTRRGQEAGQGFSSVLQSVARSRSLNSQMLNRNVAAQAPERLQELERQVASFRQILAEGVSPMSGERMDPLERATYERRLSDAMDGVAAWRDVLQTGDAGLGGSLGNRVAQSMQDWTDETIGVPPQDDSLWSQLAYGGGSMGAFMLPALLGPVGVAGTAQMGADAARMEAYDRALQAGASVEEAEQASVLAGFMGTSEAIPIATALRMLPAPLRGQVMGRLGRIISEAGIGAAEEALQEAAAAVGQNLIARGVYDPDQQIITRDVGEQALVGLILGGIMGAGAGYVSRGDGEAAPRGAVTTEEPRQDEPEDQAPRLRAPQQPFTETPAQPPRPPEGQIAPAVRTGTEQDQAPQDRGAPASPDAAPGSSPEQRPVVQSQPQVEERPAVGAGRAPAAGEGRINPQDWAEIPGIGPDGSETGRSFMENGQTGEVISRQEYERRLGQQAEAEAGGASGEPVASPEAPPQPPAPQQDPIAQAMQPQAAPAAELTPAPEPAPAPEAAPPAAEPAPAPEAEAVVGNTVPDSERTFEAAGTWWDGLSPDQRRAWLEQQNPNGNPETRERFAGMPWGDISQTVRDMITRKAPDAAFQERQVPSGDLPARQPQASGGQVQPGMSVEVGGRRYPIQSYQQASEMVRKAIESGGFGASQTEFPSIYDASGNQIGYVSYNGRVWPGTQSDTGSRTPIFDPIDQSDAVAASNMLKAAQDSGRLQVVDGSAGDRMRAEAQAAIPEGYRLVSIRRTNETERDSGLPDYVAEVRTDNPGALEMGRGYGDTPAEAVQAAVTHLQGKMEGTAEGRAPEQAGANRIERDDQADAERDAPEPQSMRARWDGMSRADREALLRRMGGMQKQDGTLTKGGQNAIGKAWDDLSNGARSKIEERWNALDEGDGQADTAQAEPTQANSGVNNLSLESEIERGDLGGTEAIENSALQERGFKFGHGVWARNYDSGLIVNIKKTLGKWKITSTDRRGSSGSVPSQVVSEGRNIFAMLETLDEFLSNKLGRNDPNEAQASPEQAGEPEPAATVRLGQRIARMIADGETIKDNRALMAMAAEEFGGTIAGGAFSPKDAYEALELGVNLTIQRLAREQDAYDPSVDTASLATVSSEGLAEMVDALPTQTRRDIETDQFQQFSTPPAYAYAVNWLANIPEGASVLEPSAGNGGIAVFASNVPGGTKVDVNELSDRRVPSLEALGFDRVTTENAEQIGNIWANDPSRRYDVVVMNPPFSASAGRTNKNTSATGAKHIEQALSLLKPGGRLVAIMGHTFRPSNSRVAPFFNRLGRTATLRANVEVNGDAVYKKYGTSYDSRVLIIDKIENADGIEPVTGRAETIADLIRMLEDTRNDTHYRSGQAEADGANVAPSDGEGSGAPDADGRAGERGREPERASQPDDMGGAGDGPARNGRSDRQNGDDARAGEGGAVSDRQGEPGSDDAGTGAAGSRGATAPDRQRQSVKTRDAEQTRVEETAGGFAKYRPTRVRIDGAKEHPMLLVESSAMASVNPPRPAYEMQVPEAMVKKGLLSEAQLEQVLYAGAAHQEMLPADGNKPARRRGYMIGDGTGVGKTREIAGIIADNWAQGRKRAILISKDKKLFSGARRDFDNVGMKSVPIADLGGVKPDQSIPSKTDGVMFSTYSTLARAPRAGQKSRIDQLTEWLGPDFDGVIVFDEAHLAGNAIPIKGKRGTTKPSNTALAVVDLQNALPNARVVYASATAATEVHNLAYADRLGLWGPGTPFPNVNSFVTQIDSGGIAAMEVVARDMKQMGVYMARTLSFEGVEYEKVEHELTPPQRQMYDAAAQAWQRILSNINEVVQEHTEGGGRQRGAALAQFWGAHQRFFQQVLTSMQMPTVLTAIKADLKSGLSPVIQIVNTNEAATNRAVGRLEEGDTLDDIDITPRDDLIQYLETSFPIHQYEEYEDSDGRVRVRPVQDSKGNYVVNAEAVRIRDDLVAEMSAMTLPGNPLDMIIEQFGAENVAEVTGRTTRIVTKNGRKVSERRTQNKTLAEAKEFQAGKRQLLVFSDAGGTGMDFHADKSAKNQSRRSHYVLQAGWRADRAIQGFGRTHRTNQASAPVYKLAGTNLSGHKRFTSSIARRLDQLGALTKGQKDASGSGMFSAADNLENAFAENAVMALFKEIYARDLDWISPADVERELGLQLEGEKGFNVSKVPPVPQFLNRLLNTTIDRQNRLFDRFMEHMDAAIQHAIDNGEFTAGVEEITHSGAEIVDTQEAYRNPDNGATSEYRMVKIRERTEVTPFSDINKFSTVRYKKHRDTGVVYAFRPASSRTNERGEVIPTYHRFSPTHRQIIDSTNYRMEYETVQADEAEAAWNEAIAAAPEYTERNIHMVTGALLPIWDRLPQSSPRIKRITLDDGRTILGREIPDVELMRTLERLGVNGPSIDMSAGEMLAAAMSGKTVILSSGHRIVRRKVGGEQRVEIIPEGASTYEDMRPGGTFQRAGFQIERINYKARAFIPNSEAGQKSLTDFMRGKSIANVTTERNQSRLDMFYSPLLRAVEGAKQQRAPAKDWQAILAKLPGVKQVEIEWLGVNEWLASQEGAQVPREALEQFIRDGQINLVESRLAGDEGAADIRVDVDYDNYIEPDWESEAEIWMDEARDEAIEEDLDRDPDDIPEDEIKDIADRLARERWEPTEFRAYAYNATTGENIAYGSWDNESREYYFPDLDMFGGSEPDVIEAAEDFLRRQAHGEGGSDGPARFEEYTEPGGDNYREILLRVPNLHKMGPNAAKQGVSLYNKDPFVQPAHFEQENIVVHARVKDRTGPNGERVLFVEEIQSDLASKWREETESPEATARRREVEDEFRRLQAEMESLSREAVPVVWQYQQDGNGDPLYTPGQVIGQLFANVANGRVPADRGAKTAVDALKERDGELYDRIIANAQAIGEIDRERLRLGTEKRMDPTTPDTPFKEEHTYTLMVKRLLREAAANGYDRLAWTPGYMQAERWNAAAQSVVENVRWGSDADEAQGGAADGKVVSLEMSDGYETMGFVVGDSGVITRSLYRADGAVGKPLSALIGPNLTKRVMDEPSGSVEGQKITFPDSGYAIAYDQQTKRAVDKLAKGTGARVEQVDDIVMPTGDMRARPGLGREPDVSRPGEWVPVNSRVWSITITDALREKAMQPQAILREGQSGGYLRQPVEPYTGLTTNSRVFKGLRKSLDDLGLKNVDLRLDPQFTHQGKVYTDHFGRIAITIGQTLNPRWTMGHEAIHVYKHMGVFTAEEWSLLSETAEAEWMDRYGIADRYPDLTREEMVEESVAEAFGEVYERRDNSFVSRPVLAALRKIANFLKAVRNWANGFGFQTSGDILHALARGEMAPRAERARRPDGWQSQTDRLLRHHRRPGMIEGSNGALHLPDRKVWDTLIHENHETFRGRLRETGGAVRDRMDTVRARLQDRMLPMRRALEQIERVMGRPVPEELNAYLAEEMYSGRAGHKLDVIERQYVEPIMDIIGKTKGMTAETVGRYLYARHAEERNERIAEINPDMPDGGSGMSTEEANAILEEIHGGEQADQYREIAKMIDSLRDWSVQLRVDAGLMTEFEAEGWRRTYERYVPLKGWSETEGSDGQLDISGLGRGYNVRGDETRRALGRRSEAFNPLIAALTQAQEAAVRAEKNLVGQHLYRLAKDLPSRSLWTVKRAETRRVFNEATGLVEERTVAPITLLQAQNEFAVKVDGQEHRVMIHDPRLARAMSLVGSDAMIGPIRILSHFSRYFSAMNTMLNPAFLPKNVMRDMLTATLNVRRFPNSAKIQRKMLRTWPKALLGAYRGLGGKEDTTWSRYYQEFSEAGGKVSFWVIENPEASKARLDRMARRKSNPLGMASALVTPRISENPFLQAIERINLAADNAVRLAAFVAAREEGYSVKQAASLAKNLTVNFNRRGEWGSIINAAYTFSNAGFQGTHMILKSLKDSAYVRRAALGLVAIGFLLDQANSYLSDEDEDGELFYDQIPDYTHQMNAVLMLGTGPDTADTSLRLFLPYGYNVFPYIGNRLSRLERGVINQDQVIGDIALTAFNSFSPISGQDFLSTISPTIVQPFVEMATNRNFFGGPVYRQYQQPGLPDSQFHTAGATRGSIILADALNTWTGGTYAESGYLDFSPDSIDHLSGFLTGGAGRFIGRSANFVALAVNDTPGDISTNDVPLLRDIYVPPQDWWATSLYWDRRHELQEAHYQARRYEEAGDPVPDDIRWRADLWRNSDVRLQAERMYYGRAGVSQNQERAILLLNSAYVRAMRRNTPYSGESIFDGLLR